MMHRQPNRPTHIHMNTLVWQCDVHGPHRIIIAGLDETADLAADALREHPTWDGARPSLDRDLLPLDKMRGAVYSKDEDDDLPF